MTLEELIKDGDMSAYDIEDYIISNTPLKVLASKDGSETHEKLTALLKPVVEAFEKKERESINFAKEDINRSYEEA